MEVIGEVKEKECIIISILYICVPRYASHVMLWNKVSEHLLSFYTTLNTAGFFTQMSSLNSQSHMRWLLLLSILQRNWYSVKLFILSFLSTSDYLVPTMCLERLDKAQLELILNLLRTKPKIPSLKYRTRKSKFLR